MEDATLITIVGSILGTAQALGTLYLKGRIDKARCKTAECVLAVKNIIQDYENSQDP
jgi:hypothetical protein